MTSSPLNPVCFLLVDDLEENLVALEALLRRENLVLLKARSGTQALELLLKHDVALTLVDVQMPEMDGFELAELMRGTERTRRVPIIFLTAGHADWQRRFRGYEAGAVDFLQKPIEPDILRSKADVFYELYRQRQEVAQQRDELKLATEENARLLKESRAQGEQLKLADRRKDEFLATLAHELRNPLAPIRNGMHVLRLAKGAGPDVPDMLRTMEDQVTHLVRLVDDLLEISRITQGKVELRKSRIDLNKILEGAVATSRPAVEAGRHQLTIDAPPDPLTLHADPTRVTQIFSNLLNNAARYTNEGGRIEMHARRDGDEAVVTVRDTGVGIPSEMLSRVFDLFTQVDNTLVRAHSGLGIGLTLVKNFVELHGGRIEARSHGPGQGSEFIVRLPLAPPAASPVASNGKTIDIDTLPRRRILVVDDTRSAATMLCRLLEALNQDVRSANDAATAIECAVRERPEIVLSDIAMPRMDGYELARRLRREPSLKDVVLVALTGYGQESDRRRAREAGFDVHLVKPVDLEALKRLIASPQADAAPSDGSSESG
jgi:signal transduction histidine kinase